MDILFKLIIIIIIGFGNIKLLNYISVYEETNLETEVNSKESNSRNRKYKIALNIFSVFSIILGIYVFSIILKELNSLGVDEISEEGILIKANRKVIAVFSILNGLLYGSTIPVLITKKILKRRWNSYLSYEKAKENGRFYANIKLAKIITVFVCFGTFLMTDFYSFFGKDEILINDFMGIGAHKYKYSEITSIKHIEKFYSYEGKHADKEFYIIKFHDRRKWNSIEDGLNDRNKNKLLIKMIQEKSKVPIIELEYSDE